MTAPSIKEALELKPCPFCGGNGKMIHPMGQWTKEGKRGYGLPGSRITCERRDCAGVGKACYGPNQDDDAIAAWNTRATLSPPAGERREAIAQRLACAHSAHALTAYRAGAVPAVEYWNKLADAALASGLVQDEAGIRRDEREKCAKALDDIETDADGKCHWTDVALATAAIRSARDGGAGS